MSSVSNLNHKHHARGISMSCSLSMTQSTTQKSEDFYAEIEDANHVNRVITSHELDEMVMNFSHFNTKSAELEVVHDDAELSSLKEENCDLRQQMQRVLSENCKLKQMLLEANNKSSSSYSQEPQYSPCESSQCTANATPTLSIAASSSTPVSPFDIAQYVYNKQ
eukprot:175880_1